MRPDECSGLPLQLPGTCPGDLCPMKADPIMGAEDFSYMLAARPGAYLFIGQGEGAGLHTKDFDFNDEISPYGASFFARLVEKAQPVGI